ncbi:sugar transferase [Candidatus Uabimicrobium amorphum]|uniref:Glycosyl transferase n=1 Tax=Uabimicrobium amorphum TaxID=2596890 RepID=A0A5S9F2E9_UABAM|nr:sugar transferase [Candidatus Uabimicrobium amorphum]BBM82389.1 glycosyl transferase [Candidatus Uabimicrobium amorphum]
MTKNGIVWSLRNRIFLLKLGEIVTLTLSMFLSLFLWEFYSNSSMSYTFRQYQTMVFLELSWIFVAMISESYDRKNIQNLFLYFCEPLRTAFFCGVIYAVFYFFSPRNTLPRGTAFIYCIASCFLTIIWRYTHFKIFSWQELRENIVIIATKNLLGIDKRINKSHFSVVEIIAPSQLEKILNRNLQKVHRIIYNPNEITKNEIYQLCALNDRGIQIISIYTFYEELFSRVSLESPDLLELPHIRRNLTAYKFLKRGIDLTGALIGLAFAFSLLPFVALLIKIDSSGPIFFSQMRKGKNGKNFRLWKLRTMFAIHEENHMWTQKKDLRITRIGKLLRKTRIDELPQLWNVLRGDVSLVGVRPLSIEQCEKFAKEIPYHNLRHLITPGITGWAVINQGYVNSNEGALIRLEYDLFYVKHCNMWLDLFILMRTITTVITLKGL